MDVAEAESMLALDRVFDQVARDPWTPPTNLGPLPAHLVDRARTLLARQLSVSQQLASAARNSRKHDRALAQLHAHRSSPPVYVDTPAVTHATRSSIVSGRDKRHSDTPHPPF